MGYMIEKQLWDDCNSHHTHLGFIKVGMMTPIWEEHNNDIYHDPEIVGYLTQLRKDKLCGGNSWYTLRNVTISGND